MAIETPTEYGGSGSSFTAAIIAIEELAKVDPSVSVLCDVHNTLVNTIFRTYGTEKQKERFLPVLAEKSVSCFSFRPLEHGRRVDDAVLLAWLVLLVRAGFWLGRVRTSDARGEGWRRLDNQWLEDVDNELVRSRRLSHLRKRKPTLIVPRFVLNILS